MTTITFAAAQRATRDGAQRARRPLTLASLAAVLGFALAGCGTTATDIFSTAGGTAVAPEQAAPASATQGTKIAIAPVIGAPDGVAKQLQAQLGTAMQRKQIAVVNSPSEPSQYTLRGYVVSAREASGTKISYIWDVTDPAGKRVNRITGEELAPAGSGRDPWEVVTPQILETISEKTATSLATWLPSQASNSPAIAGNASAQPMATASNGGAMVQTAAATTSATPQNAAATTGSIGRAGAVSAIVPSVTGAPGDGSVSLTNALQKQLTSNGIALASAASPQTYRIEGKVKVGTGTGGKQPIQIDWRVKDPAGKTLGTVSQKNEIPEGSLDGSWGQTADAAAAAAAQGILKLLPQTKTN
ncbi:hypothetical protein SAMN04488061_2173 [Filomicrobium insigne]|uniref:Lipoprotein n=1 Tax=Filomicrobium insigne TaxID=418854 RepID=A0A1H0PYF5_9HYPH|nr:hypothetical protein [Filomicrobium insigne]SDP09459.1 hypothetical protein SAMN04488061_2173 [Filomicrobium insigne]